MNSSPRTKTRHVFRIVFFTVLVLSLAIFITNTFLANVLSSGWIYTGESNIAMSTAFPRDFGGVSIVDNSIYLSLINGRFYKLGLNGNTVWSSDMQDYTIYPPVIDGKTVFITSFDGRLYALDKITGKEQWRFAIPNYLKADTEPQISGDLVLFGGRDGILYALDKQTGAMRWNFKTNPIDYSHITFGENIIHFGRFSTDADTVYVNSATNDSIYALDRVTGNTLWSFENYGFVFQKPNVFSNSISIWDDKGSYWLLEKTTGRVLFKAAAPRRLLEYNNRIYIANDDNSIDAVDSVTGQRIWKYQEQGSTPKNIQITGTTTAYLAVLNDIKNTQLLSLVDLSSGGKLWTIPMNIVDLLSITGDGHTLYSIGKNSQCAFHLNDGSEIWCTTIKNSLADSYITSEGLYIISENKPNLEISYINKNTGTIMWQFASDTINKNSIREKSGNLYFVTNDTLSLVMLGKDSFHKQIRISQLQKRVISVRQTNALYTFGSAAWTKLSQMTVPEKSPVTVSAPQTSIQKNDVFEITITLDDSVYTDKQKEVQITALFTNPGGKKYSVKGFYYDKNTWKARFTPDTTGTWSWNIHVQSPYTGIDRSGTFNTVDSLYEGFLRISSSDPRSFITDQHTLFYPIGIQDCIQDMNSDGDPLDQWSPGIDPAPPVNPTTISVYPMEYYLSLYKESGFNLWRWGAGNCSYNLWLEFSPHGNRYALNEALRTDLLFQALKHKGYHIWMSVFSFKLPFASTLPAQDKMSILKDYLDYVIARYSGYVDIWELANEIKLDDPLIKFMSDYIRANDPYHHPVTTNWERPELSSIDIDSVHWYSQECTACYDEDLIYQISHNQNSKKPVIYSEQGNWHTNWDGLSATRLRIRLWLGFFNKLSYIFWNASVSLFVNVQQSTQGPSNIYLGPVERQYVSVFSNFIAGARDPLSEYPLTSEDRVYALRSENQILGYVYRQINDLQAKPTTVIVSVPEDGTIQWVDTSTGTILSEEPAKQGAQLFTSPDFTTDIAFKISLGTR